MQGNREALQKQVLELPCENCITLPVCKAKLGQEGWLEDLEIICSMMKDYLNTRTLNEYSDRFYKVLRIMER